VLAILISALVALGQTIERFIHPRSLSHLWLLAGAGVIGFVGNEIAAQVRLRAGRKLQSPAVVADGQHARVDGFVSLGVLASATVVALGLKGSGVVDVELSKAGLFYAFNLRRHGYRGHLRFVPLAQLFLPG
jgi:divalent metal cation (Fe/Co/Zn/Cd) transporter